MPEKVWDRGDKPGPQWWLQWAHLFWRSCSKLPRSNLQPCAVCLIRKPFWPSQLKVPALASLPTSLALKRWTLASGFRRLQLGNCPSGSVPQSRSLSMGLCFQSWLNKAQRSPSWAESSILIFPWGLEAGLLFGCHSAFELLWLRLLSGSASCQEVDLPDLLLFSLQDDESLNLHYSLLFLSRQPAFPATSCSLCPQKWGLHRWRVSLIRLRLGVWRHGRWGCRGSRRRRCWLKGETVFFLLRAQKAMESSRKWKGDIIRQIWMQV